MTSESLPPILQGILEEANTLLAFHASHVKSNVTVRASDNDVMAILVGMLGRQLTDLELPASPRIMDYGSGNSRRHIDVSGIVTVLETTQEDLA